MKDKNAAEPETITQGVTNGQQDQNVELTIQDLQALKNIIEVCTQRGAFKAKELLSVGVVFSKLENFLKAVNEAQSKE